MDPLEPGDDGRGFFTGRRVPGLKPGPGERVKDVPHGRPLRRTVTAFQHESQGHAGRTEDMPGHVPEIFREYAHVTDRVIGQDILAGGYNDKVRVHAGDRRQEYLIEHEG